MCHHRTSSLGNRFVCTSSRYLPWRFGASEGGTLRPVHVWEVKAGLQEGMLCGALPPHPSSRQHLPWRSSSPPPELPGRAPSGGHARGSQGGVSRAPLSTAHACWVTSASRLPHRCYLISMEGKGRIGPHQPDSSHTRKWQGQDPPGMEHCPTRLSSHYPPNWWGQAWPQPCVSSAQRDSHSALGDALRHRYRPCRSHTSTCIFMYVHTRVHT